ncbi:hypothetical protein Trydic_g15985 [Trypoxylus dichotomus]
MQFKLGRADTDHLSRKAFKPVMEPIEELHPTVKQGVQSIKEPLLEMTPQLEPPPNAQTFLPSQKTSSASQAHEVSPLHEYLYKFHTIPRTHIRDLFHDTREFAIPSDPVLKVLYIKSVSIHFSRSLETANYVIEFYNHHKVIHARCMLSSRNAMYLGGDIDVDRLNQTVHQVKTLRYIANLFPPDITQLLKHCLWTSYFVWDGSFYEQTDGIAMESSLNPVVVNLHGAVREPNYRNNGGQTYGLVKVRG